MEEAPSEAGASEIRRSSDPLAEARSRSFNVAGPMLGQPAFSDIAMERGVGPIGHARNKAMLTGIGVDVLAAPGQIRFRTPVLPPR
jgi:hypothetical protein